MGLFSRDNDVATDAGDFLSIDPNLGLKPTLPAGDHEAVLDRCDVRESRFAGQGTTPPDMKCDHFEFVVRHDTLGIVRLFADKDRIQGTQAVRWFRQLGVTDTEMREGFDRSKLIGLPVQVTVRISEYEKDGETRQKNVVTNVIKL